MQGCGTIREARAAIGGLRAGGAVVGFVPTMGALHVGHEALIRRAREECGVVVVSVFVNPMQFGPGEDFESYPRTVEADLKMCEGAGVDVVFLPDANEMYRRGSRTTVYVSELTEGLCGASRLGHFDGVTTVVTKLFNMVRPDRAYFGEKDYQQLKVIERMAVDLDMGVEVVGCETVREADGLAISSRNAYLSDEERSRALSLSRALREAADMVAGGERDAGKLTALARSVIESAGAGACVVDYIEVVDAESLAPVERIESEARMCLAVRIGTCRLIDNMRLDPSGLRG